MGGPAFLSVPLHVYAIGKLIFIVKDCEKIPKTQQRK